MVVLRKMKEKCKDAARLRREKERVEFVELSKLLPLPSSTTSQLDKASIIRLTSSYLRMRTAFPQGLGERWGSKRRLAHQNIAAGSMADYSRDGYNNSVDPPKSTSQQIKELGSLLLQTLDGFVFALHRDGKIMYVSETASVHLGLPQIDLTGSSVFEYIHPADHNGIMEVLNLTDAEHLELVEKQASGLQNKQQLQANGEHDDILELGRSFCMRMKCVLPKRNAGLVSNGYKAIHCSGYLKVRYRPPGASAPATPKRTKFASTSCEGRLSDQRVWESYALVAVGHSLLPTASTETKLGSRTFMFRANLDLKLYYLETQMSNLLDYQQSELVGQSLYQFVHIADLSCLEQAHKQVLDKGQVVSRYHRLMRRDGGFIWVQIHATLINNPRSMPKPQHIVGICCVIGESQLDESRALLISEPTSKLEQTTNLTTKKSSDKLSSPVKKSISAHVVTKSSLKIPTRQIGKRDRGQKQTLHGHRIEGKSRFARVASSKQRVSDKINVKIMTQSKNTTSATYHTIGSTRRPSDDTCSVVSSITSTTSTSSTCGHNYGTYGRTPTSTVSSSPPNEMITTNSVYLFKSDSMYTPTNQHDHHAQLPDQIQPQLPLNADVQYSGRAQDGLIIYETPNYWPLSGAPYEQTSQSLGGDTACNQVAVCWPVASSTTTSPPTTPACQIANSEAPAVSSSNEAYTMPPEEAYVCNQHYYKLNGQATAYNHDEYMGTYSNEVQTYSDYQGGNMNRTHMTFDDQTYSYYASHQETACLTGSSSA